MDRREFVKRTGGAAALGIAFMALNGKSAWAKAQTEATPAPSTLPELELILKDDGFEIAQMLTAGRYHVSVSNVGASTESHSGLGKIPDTVTDAQYEAWLQSRGEAEDVFTWDDIAFVGLPDWPRPGGSVTGVIDLVPGRYFLFDPGDVRGHQTIVVDGAFTAAEEPTADLTVTLREMEIVLPDTAFTTEAVRWKIENTGGMSHEVAVIPVSSDFTDEQFQHLFTLPEDATPAPGDPEFIYQPVAAIGILAGEHTSWLDVKLEPGRYLAACMLPFGTGYPHVMDGMYRFFDVE